MVRYLFKLVGADGLLKLINRYNDSGNLDAAFSETYGANIEQFYLDWRQNGIPPFHG